MKPVVVILAACLMATGQGTAAREGVASLAKRLRLDPGNLGLMAELAKHVDDPSAIPALRDIFALDKTNGFTSELGSSRLPASFLAAMTLIRAGVRDEAYFDEMAGYVSTAIAADPPAHVFLAGPDGSEQLPKERYDPGFEAWCAKRSLEPAPCLQELAGYAVVLGLLSGLGDPRAIPVPAVQLIFNS